MLQLPVGRLHALNRPKKNGVEISWRTEKKEIGKYAHRW